MSSELDLLQGGEYDELVRLLDDPQRRERFVQSVEELEDEAPRGEAASHFEVDAVAEGWISDDLLRGVTRRPGGLITRLPALAGGIALGAILMFAGLWAAQDRLAFNKGPAQDSFLAAATEEIEGRLDVHNEDQVSGMLDDYLAGGMLKGEDPVADLQRLLLLYQPADEEVEALRRRLNLD